MPHEPTCAGAVRPVEDKPSGTWHLRRADAQNIRHLTDASIGLVLTALPTSSRIPSPGISSCHGWFRLIDAACLSIFPADQLAAISKSPDTTERFTAGMTRAFSPEEISV
jgi:hypothetical protein